MSRPKETGFFFEDYGKGIDWFSNECFPHYDGEPAVGEASAGNMMHREVAPRIATHCPDARLVFILRDPVERIWSHYRFDINVGALPPTADFSELIRDETSEWRDVMVELGMYRDQLTNYADHFSSDQMRVFLFESVSMNSVLQGQLDLSGGVNEALLSFSSPTRSRYAQKDLHHRPDRRGMGTDRAAASSRAPTRRSAHGGPS